MFWFKDRLPKPPNPRGNRGGTPLPKSLRVDPIVGYRTWRVRPTPQGVALHSLVQAYVWEEENTAECRLTTPTWPAPPHTGKAPYQGCECGFYIVGPDSSTNWDNQVRGRVSANGDAALSGRVIICEAGYKAQYATLVSPIVVDVECGKPGCMGPVEKIQLEGSPDFWGWCDVHEGRRDLPYADAVVWMRETLRQLDQRYPNTEFHTFLEV